MFFIFPGIPQTCIQLSLQLNTALSSAQIRIHTIVPGSVGPLQMLEAVPLPIFLLQRGLDYQGFNLLVLISIPALFAYTLQVSLLPDDLLDFVILPALLKFNKRIKKEGSAGIEQHVSFSTEVVNICSDFFESSEPELSFHREMKLWIICVLYFCLPWGYCDVYSKGRIELPLKRTVSLLSAKMIPIITDLMKYYFSILFDTCENK